jgi:phage terminase large subunit-like protein
MHRNQWVTSTETFVPMEWWDACRRDPNEWPVVDMEKTPMVISMDAGVSDDNFGMTMQFRHPTINTDVCIEKVKKWKPRNGKIDFQGTPEDPGPEMILKKWISEYNVVQVSYDPYQLHDMANRMRKEEKTWFKKFNQGNDRLLADSQIRNLIRDRKVWHRGEPDLRDHIQNADAKVDTEDHKIRIVKRADQLKIDLLVTMSMGSYEVLRLNL